MGTIEFRLPDVGEGIDAAVLQAWKVAPGEAVVEDQPMADVETDKAVVELPCPATGVVSELRFEPGQRVEVGEVLIVIGEGASAEADSLGAAATSGGPHKPATEAAEPSHPTPTPAQEAPVAAPTASASRPLASPATRRLARELGIDLQAIEGTGPGGRIERDDVQVAHRGVGLPPSTPAGRSASVAPPVDVGETQVIPLSGIRRTIAHRLTEAWQQVPRVIDYREVDATRLLGVRRAVRDAARARGDEELAKGLTLLPFVIKIACRALAEHPYVNSSIDLERDEITLHPSCHIAIATATPDGLMVPVIRSAESRSIAELGTEAVALAEAAQARALRPEQLSGGTFTVNNYGGLGIWLGTPIVVPPQVANLGIGRIEERPVVRDGEIVVRHVLPLSVSGDHRVLDGDTLAAFVSRVVELMEQPDLLLEEAR